MLYLIQKMRYFALTMCEATEDYARASEAVKTLKNDK